LPLLENSDDFVFDNQMLAQCVMFGFRMGEVSCPTKYFPEASSINFRRSVKYGLGVLLTSVQFRMQKLGLAKFRIFSSKGRCLEPVWIRATTRPRWPTSGRAGSVAAGSVADVAFLNKEGERPARTSLRDLVLLAVATVAAFLVHGYHPAAEDAAIYLPGIKKLLHPALYPYNDQFLRPMPAGRCFRG